MVRKQISFSALASSAAAQTANEWQTWGAAAVQRRRLPSSSQHWQFFGKGELQAAGGTFKNFNFLGACVDCSIVLQYHFIRQSCGPALTCLSRMVSVGHGCQNRGLRCDALALQQGKEQMDDWWLKQ